MSETTTDQETAVENSTDTAALAEEPTPGDEKGVHTVDNPDDDQADAVENPVAAAKGRENSKLRERLRDTTAKLETMYRAEAERQAGQRLGKGVDLWAGGIELDSLLDDDGNLSPELVDKAVADVLEQHPHWRISAAAPASTVTANGKIGAGKPQPSFTDAFKPRKD